MLNRCMRRYLLLALVTIAHATTVGAQPAERTATRQEIIGSWELVPVPDSLQPKIFKQNPWPAACQWYSYGADGTLNSFYKFRDPCEPTTAAELSSVFALFPPVVSWQYDLGPVFGNALIIVKRTDVKDYAECWEPHYVARTFTARGGVEITQGDLLLYLVNMESKQIIWIRHLRRIG